MQIYMYKYSSCRQDGYCSIHTKLGMSALFCKIHTSTRRKLTKKMKRSTFGTVAASTSTRIFKHSLCISYLRAVSFLDYWIMNFMINRLDKQKKKNWNRTFWLNNSFTRSFHLWLVPDCNFSLFSYTVYLTFFSYIGSYVLYTILFCRYIQGRIHGVGLGGTRPLPAHNSWDCRLRIYSTPGLKVYHSSRFVLYDFMHYQENIHSV